MAKQLPAQGSQYPLVSYLTLNLAEDTMVDVNGVTKALNEDGVLPAIPLPPKSIVIGGSVVVSTASDAATTHTLDIGDTDDTDRYTGTAVDLKTAARTALTLTGFNNIVGNDVLFTIATTGTAATTGTVTVFLHYVISDRQNENS